MGFYDPYNKHNYVHTYVDDILCFTTHTFDKHLKQTLTTFRQLQSASTTVNPQKSLLAYEKPNYLGYWIKRSGI